MSRAGVLRAFPVSGITNAAEWCKDFPLTPPKCLIATLVFARLERDTNARDSNCFVYPDAWHRSDEFRQRSACHDSGLFGCLGADCDNSTRDPPARWFLPVTQQAERQVSNLASPRKKKPRRVRAGSEVMGGKQSKAPETYRTAWLMVS